MTWHQYGGNFDNPINPEYEQEARLVEQSRAGSERAFSALLARYQQPVFRLILYLVGDEDEARDLTRIAIKNALLHMPSVPSGYSIRPWLLRVAVLVALDAVRDRSESPQELIASLQLPPPQQQVPRIVDADPSESDTMVLGITRLDALATHPETAIADAWDMLPLDVERELIRRLLAGLPEGDAELLALGVVGQVPTRDLAALAGTSQRSVRRRIARALILFQSRYQGVRTEALPPAPETKELPQRTSSTITAPLVDAARRGLAEANNLMKRGIQGVRTGFGSVDAQERLQTLRANKVPPAGVTPVAPVADMPQEPLDLADADFFSYTSYTVEAQATQPTLPINAGQTYDAYQDDNDADDQDEDEPAETQRLAAVIPPEDVQDDVATTIPGTFDPQSYSAWTSPVPSMELPDLRTSAMPIVHLDEPGTMPMFIIVPEESMSASPTITETPPITSTIEDIALVDVIISASDAPDTTTLVRPSSTPDVQSAPTSTTLSRKLPRFGPPPEDVIVGTPAAIDPFTISNAMAAELAEVVAESVDAPIAMTVADEPVAVTPAVEPIAAAVTDESVAESIIPELALAATPSASSDADICTIPVVADVAQDETVMRSESPPIVDAIVSEEPYEQLEPEELVTVPVFTEEPAATTVIYLPPSADQVPEEIDREDNATEALPDDPFDEDPFDGGEAPAGEAAVPPPLDPPADEPAPTVVATSGTWDDQPSETPFIVVAAHADSTASSESVRTEPLVVDADPLPTIVRDAPAVAAIERDETSITQVPPKRSHGSTVVVSPMARQEYVSRHRPAWLDAGDLGSIPGVALEAEMADAEAPHLESPAVPAMGALTLPVPTESAANAEAQDAPMAMNDITASDAEDDAAPLMDLADLADITALPPEAVPVPSSAEDAPTSAVTPPPAAQRLRPPSRPMPKLERDST